MSAFEVFSAFGTVGLSMNFTTLNDDWKSYYYLYDVFGKMGPLTLAFHLHVKEPENKISE